VSLRFNLCVYLDYFSKDMPMPVIEQTITIQKPLFDVFRMATDVAQWGTWQNGVKNVALISGDPIRTGTMISLERGSTFINADVTDYQRQKTLSLTGVWGRFRFARLTEFSSTGRETTIRDKLTVQTGFLWFWYNPILTSQLNGQIKADWAALKKLLESS
jgi:hypothetical protein